MKITSSFPVAFGCVLLMALASLRPAQGGPFDILKKENLGGLKVGSPEKQVVALLGEPAKRGKLEMQEATGDYVEEWDFPAKGLNFVMTTGAKKTGAKTIFAILATKGCSLATKAGIKVGSSESEVRKAYAAIEDKDSPAEKGSFIAGSIYGGIIFTFANGKVSQIFFGAAAE